MYENILQFLFLKQAFSIVKELLQRAAACLHGTLYIHPSIPFKTPKIEEVYKLLMGFACYTPC